MSGPDARPIRDAGPPGEPAIWMYWEDQEGTTRPAYLDVCSSTIDRHRGTLAVRVVDRASAGRWLPGLRPEWERLPSIAHRADYVRSRLLLRYGGIWLDADVIVLRDLRSALEPLHSHDFVGYGLDRGVVETGFLVARPGCRLMSMWAEEQDRVLDEANRRDALGSLGWTELAHDILSRLVPTYPCHSFPVPSIAPIAWQDWRRFLSTTESAPAWLRGDPLTVMLYNRVMRAALEGMSKEQLLASPTLLGQFVRAGLGMDDGTAGSRRHRILAPARRLYWGPAGRFGRRAFAYGRWRARQLSRRWRAS